MHWQFCMVGPLWIFHQKQIIAQNIIYRSWDMKSLKQSQRLIRSEPFEKLPFELKNSELVLLPGLLGISFDSLFLEHLAHRDAPAYPFPWEETCTLIFWQGNHMMWFSTKNIRPN
jgi:hypothetical protein